MGSSFIDALIVPTISSVAMVTFGLIFSFRKNVLQWILRTLISTPSIPFSANVSRRDFSATSLIVPAVLAQLIGLAGFGLAFGRISRVESHPPIWFVVALAALAVTATIGGLAIALWARSLRHLNSPGEEERYITTPSGGLAATVGVAFVVSALYASLMISALSR